MKRNWKKVLSLVLALAMVLTMNTSVFATALDAAPEAATAETPAAGETTPAEEVKQEEAKTEVTPAAEQEKAAEETTPAAEAEAEAAPAAEETQSEEAAAAETVKEAAKEEAAEAPKAETAAEEEQAVEGSETGDPYILTDWTTPKTVSGLNVTFNKYASVRVSENEASIIVKNGEAGVYGINSSASYNQFTITVEKGATLYAGFKFLENGSYESDYSGPKTYGLGKVTIKGEGTVIVDYHTYNFEKYDFIIGDGVNLKILPNGKNWVNRYVISINDVYYAEDATYTDETTTWNIARGGLVKIYGADYDTSNDEKDFVWNWYGSTGVSLNTITVAGKTTLLEKNADGSFKKGNYISENKTYPMSEFSAGDTVWFFDGTKNNFQFAEIPGQYEAPDKTKISTLFDGALRKNGINISQLNPKFDEDETVQYILVSADNAVKTPSVNAAGWSDYAENTVFSSVLDDTKVREGVTYNLWVRRVAEYGGYPYKFISEPTDLGSFTWTARPTSPLTLSVNDSIKNYYVGDNYSGDWKQNYGIGGGAYYIYDVSKTAGNFLTNGTLTYGFDDVAGKELELEDFKKDGYYKENTYKNYGHTYTEYGNGVKVTVTGDPYVRFNVRYKGSASTVGYLDAYIISANGSVSAADVESMTRTELDADENNAFIKKSLYYQGWKQPTYYVDALNADDYFVKTFYKSLDDDKLPYDGSVSSNVVKITINKAPVEISPSMPDDDDWIYMNHSLSTMTTVSGDAYLNDISAYASSKITKKELSYLNSPISVNILKDGSAYDWSKADTELGVGTYSLSISENQYELVDDYNPPKEYVSANFALTTAEGAVYHSPRTLIITAKETEAAITGITVGSLDAMHGTTSENVMSKAYVEYTLGGVKWRAGNETKVGGQTITMNGVYTKSGDSYSIISSNEIMSEVEAGSTVYVSMDQITLSVNGVSQNVGGYIPVNIKKRPINITVAGKADRGATASEITVSAADAKGEVTIEDPGYFNWSYGFNDRKVSEKNEWNFNKGENVDIPDYYIAYKKAYFQGDSLISGDIKVKNADAIDTSTANRTYNLELEIASLAQLLETNYEIGSVTGTVTINPRYFVYYVFNYDGEKKVNKKEFKPGVEGYNSNSMTITPYKDAEDYEVWVNSMAEKYPEDGDEITGWKVTRENNINVTTIDKKSNGDFGIADYIVYAVISSYPRTGIRVQSIAPVQYSGLAYVASQTGTATKSNQCNNLALDVRGRRSGANNTWDALTYGVDYTVAYKNNINASVKFTGSDALKAYTAADPTTQLFADKSKRPQVIITGKGRYAGWKETVYFDIYPRNIASTVGYIVTPGAHYGDKRSQVTGLKDNYFVAANGKTGYSYKVQNIQYPSIVKLTQYPEYENGYAGYSGPAANTAKPKTITLKKGKDYTETLQKWDNTTYRYFNVSDKKVGIGNYNVLIKGVGNYCGEIDDNYFAVRDKSKAVDFSKFKTVKVKSSLKWTDTIGKDRTADKAASVSIGSLIQDYGLVTITAGSGKNKVPVGLYSWVDGNRNDNYEVLVRQYKADGKQYSEWDDFDDELTDAGTYTITITPNTWKGSYFYNDGKNIKVDYVGSITKKFTIKGETLKAGNFKLSWKSKKVNKNNTSDKQTVTIKKTVKPEDKQYIYSDTPADGVEVYVYGLAPSDASTWATENYKAYNLVNNAKATSYKDGGGVTHNFSIYKGNTNPNHLISVAGERAFYDNGLEYTAEQVDVYKYKMTYKPNNKDVGTYTVHVGTSGLYGIEGVDITYKRTGTANKILSIFNR